ncbi:MAG: hypothetical protein JO316_09075 [Abitibacteriaceae bacterium]|nr:hypothetical protein [Abditibacteriaceae bacterium]
MERLELLHLGTLFAYDQAILHVSERILKNFQDPTAQIERTLAKNYKYNIVAPNAQVMEQQFKQLYPGYLREILLIRVISALEVFLVDTIREVFTVRRDLFHKNDTIQYSYGQILSFESISEIATQLINKECRALQNAGFAKVIAYYQKYLDIKFEKSGLDLKELQEYHERRHLMVHRLGRTDEKYRHDYSSTDKQLSVNKRYIIHCFETVRAFAEFVYTETKSLRRQNTLTRQRKEPTTIAYANVLPLNGRGAKVIHMNYTFAAEEEILVVKDIVFSKVPHPNGSYTLGLHGSVKQVDAYLQYLQHSENKQRLKLVDFKYVRRITPKDSLPNDFVDKIEASLPDLPWSTNIHEQIANKFRISNRQSKKAIQINKKRFVSKDLLSRVSESLDDIGFSESVHIKIAEEFKITEHQAFHAIRRVLKQKRHHIVKQASA